MSLQSYVIKRKILRFPCLIKGKGKSEESGSNDREVRLMRRRCLRTLPVLKTMAGQEVGLRRPEIFFFWEGLASLFIS